MVGIIGYTTYNTNAGDNPIEYPEKIQALTDYVSTFDAYQAQRREVAKFSGEMVTFLRRLTKMSGRKFSAVLGVSASYLSKVERGLEPLSPELARTILEMHGK